MEIPSRIDLKVGEGFSFSLPGKGAAGYQWSFHLADDDHIVHITTKQASLEHLLPGASADELMIIQAQQSGIARLHLWLHRTWEPHKAPLQEQHIEIHVQR